MFDGWDLRPLVAFAILGFIAFIIFAILLIAAAIWGVVFVIEAWPLVIPVLQNAGMI